MIPVPLLRYAPWYAALKFTFPHCHVVSERCLLYARAVNATVKTGFLDSRAVVLCVGSVLEVHTVIPGSGKVSCSSSFWSKLKYLWALACVSVVNAVCDVEWVVNLKETLFHVGLSMSSKSKSNVAVYLDVAMSDRSCMFAFDVIYEAANVSVSEEEASNASGPFSLCSHQYGKRLPLRHLPQPESHITWDRKLWKVESVLCTSCYLFCKKLLEQYGEDIRSTESIMQALTAKVGDLKERLQTSNEHEEIALWRTALFLGEEMLVDHALTWFIRNICPF